MEAVSNKEGDQVAPSLTSDSDTRTIAVTIVMPCLNEAETLAICIRKALAAIAASGLPGEVVIADNGSTDGSLEIAADRRRARSPCSGCAAMAAALHGRHRKPLAATTSSWATPTTATTSRTLPRFVAALREGSDLVMGNRFHGGIKPGAMPPLHRYLGNPVLSALGSLFFGIPVRRFPLRPSRHSAGMRSSTLGPADAPAWNSPARWSSRPASWD